MSALPESHKTWSDERRLGFVEGLRAAAQAAEKAGRVARITGKLATSVAMGGYAAVIDSLADEVEAYEPGQPAEAQP